MASTGSVNLESSVREALPKLHLITEEEVYIVYCMMSLMKREGEKKDEERETGRGGGLHIYNDLSYLEGRRPTKPPNMTDV